MTPGTVAAGEGTGADGRAVAAAIAGTSWVSLPLLKPETALTKNNSVRDPTAHGTALPTQLGAELAVAQTKQNLLPCHSLRPCVDQPFCMTNIFQNNSA